ncbi:CRPV-251 [Crowpox virus]|nr:CRPV-251 [Crowpox virus]
MLQYPSEMVYEFQETVFMPMVMVFCTIIVLAFILVISFIIY